MKTWSEMAKELNKDFINDPANALKIMNMTKEFNEKNKNVKVMHSSEKMDWQTPAVLFDKLNAMYGPFNLDAAAEFGNNKCELYFDKKTDALHKNSSWSIPGFDDGNVWLNPPYGRGIGKWLKKAASEATKGCTVVCLVPSRTGSAWFQDAVKEAAEVLFLKGRVVFETAPGVPVLDKKGRPMSAPFDSAVFVFSPPEEGITGTFITWWDWRKS